MKAIVKTQNNPGKLELLDVPVPEIGPDDVLIKVEAAGICGSDLLFSTTVELPVPSTLGHEFAGIVQEVGENVKAWKPGDRVVSDNTGYACGECYACATSQYLECEHRIALGYGFDGGFAEFVKVPGQILKLNPKTLFKIPDNVSFEAASMLDPCANAYQALLQKSSFKSGDDVVIYGVGTIGLLCVQIAKVAGANNIIVMGMERNGIPETNLTLALELGATHAFVSTHENIVEKIENTLGKKPRIIIDCAGSPQVLKQALSCISNGGEIVKIGFDHTDLNIDFNIVVLKGVKIIGNMGYNYISWANSLSLMEKGAINTLKIISHRLKLSEYKTGFELMFNKKAKKVILNP